MYFTMVFLMPAKLYGRYQDEAQLGVGASGLEVQTSKSFRCEIAV